MTPEMEFRVMNDTVPAQQQNIVLLSPRVLSLSFTLHENKHPSLPLDVQIVAKQSFILWLLHQPRTPRTLPSRRSHGPSGSHRERDREREICPKTLAVMTSIETAVLDIIGPEGELRLASRLFCASVARSAARFRRGCLR